MAEFFAEVASIVRKARESSPWCENLFDNLEERDENIKQSHKQIIGYLATDGNMHDLIPSSKEFLNGMKHQWECFTADQTFQQSDITFPVRNHTFLTTDPDPHNRGYGIIDGALSILEKGVIQKNITRNIPMPDIYRVDNPMMTIFNTSSCRGSPRATDLSLALFALGYAAYQKREEDKTLTLFDFSESLRLRIENSAIHFRANLPAASRSLLNFPPQFQFDENDDNNTQVMLFHSGYAYGGMRRHQDFSNPLPPQDCSSWIAQRILPVEMDKNDINSCTFLELAATQEKPCEARVHQSVLQTLLDEVFVVKGISSITAMNAGDVLLKKGHMAMYIGCTTNGTPVTVSASRVRGSLEASLQKGAGVEGMGVFVGDPICKAAGLCVFEARK